MAGGEHSCPSLADGGLGSGVLMQRMEAHRTDGISREHTDSFDNYDLFLKDMDGEQYLEHWHFLKQAIEAL